MFAEISFCHILVFARAYVSRAVLVFWVSEASRRALCSAGVVASLDAGFRA